MNPQTLFTIIHLFGVAIGAGGAFVSDIMFFSSVRDRVISKAEMRFLKLTSKMVWTGLAILFFSGAGLFLLDMNRYLNSDKFLAKMSIVCIIVLNGAIFHASHIPRLSRHQEQHYPSSDEFMRKRSFMLVSGAVSVCSWSSALILGALRGPPYSYAQIMSVYGLLLLGAAAGALLLRNHVLPKN